MLEQRHEAVVGFALTVSYQGAYLGVYRVGGRRINVAAVGRDRILRDDAIHIPCGIYWNDGSTPTDQGTAFLVVDAKGQAVTGISETRYLAPARYRYSQQDLDRDIRTERPELFCGVDGAFDENEPVPPSVSTALPPGREILTESPPIHHHTVTVDGSAGPATPRQPVDSGNETRLLLPNGRELRCPAYPEPCSYVRVLEGEREIAYWSSDEWRIEPEEVMGALIGALLGGDKPAITSERRERVIDGVFDHIFMDRRFARDCAEAYVNQAYPTEASLSDWLSEDEDG